MPLFPKNPQRLDPYANFRFRVKMGSTYVLGISKVAGLMMSTNVIRHREGGDPLSGRTAPGQTSYDAITLERGISYNPTFGQWASEAFGRTNPVSASGQIASLLDFRRDLTIEVFNEAGMKVIAYHVQKAWVSACSAAPDLDGVGNALVVESVVVQHEGWERDDTIADAAEPTFVLPTRNPES